MSSTTPNSRIFQLRCCSQCWEAGEWYHNEQDEIESSTMGTDYQEIWNFFSFFFPEVLLFMITNRTKSCTIKLWPLRTKQEALLGLLWFRLAEAGNLSAAIGRGGWGEKWRLLWLAEETTPPLDTWSVFTAVWYMLVQLAVLLGLMVSFLSAGIGVTIQLRGQFPARCRMGQKQSSSEFIRAAGGQDLVPT